MTDGMIDYAAASLGGLIDNARQQAIADGVRPVPPGVYRSLLGYFPAALLQKCRYSTGRCGPLTLPALALSYGDATAITLGEVVLFKNEPVATNDLKVWAHELTHVMQCQRWGIEGFAERYVRDRDAVEQEAKENADRFAEWFGRRDAVPAGQIRPGAFHTTAADPGDLHGSTNKSGMATFR